MEYIQIGNDGDLSQADFIQSEQNGLPPAANANY